MTGEFNIPDEVYERAAEAIGNIEADPGEAWDDFLDDSDFRRICRAEAHVALQAALSAWKGVEEKRTLKMEAVQERGIITYTLPIHETRLVTPWVPVGEGKEQ